MSGGGFNKPTASRPAQTSDTSNAHSTACLTYNARSPKNTNA